MLRWGVSDWRAGARVGAWLWHARVALAINPFPTPFCSPRLPQFVLGAVMAFFLNLILPLDAPDPLVSREMGGACFVQLLCNVAGWL